MSTFTGVARILGVVLPRLPRLGYLAVLVNSNLGSGQRKAAAAFCRTLVSQGVPEALAEELAKEYPKLELRDVMRSLPLGRSNHRSVEDGGN